MRDAIEQLKNSKSPHKRFVYWTIKTFGFMLNSRRRETIRCWFYRVTKIRPSYCRRVKEWGLCDTPRSPRVIVSLTSYPKRIKSVHRVVEQLLCQDFKPDKVVLWLGEDKFPKKEAELPAALLRLRDFGLTIGWTRDIRSYTKLIPALKEYPEDVIVTVDDDTLYHPDMLARLYESYLKDPKAVHCHMSNRIGVDTGGKIAPYKTWKFVSTPGVKSYRNLLLGYGSVLYPPHVTDAEIFNESAFMSLSPFADDLWFWAMVVKAGNKVLTVGGKGCPFSCEYSADQSDALANVNVEGPARNDEQFVAILNAYPEVKGRLMNS